MENHHAINEKIHYFDWAIFNSELLNYQRVTDNPGTIPNTIQLLLWL